MAIVKVLATIRAKEANLRHRDCFYAQYFDVEEEPSQRYFSEASLYLPPRREWARPDRLHRGNSRRPTVEILRDSIYRKVQGVVKAGRLEEYDWGRRLVEFVLAVQRRIDQSQFVFQSPELWLRTKAVPKGGETKYRCISSYRDLSDRVVLALANKYLSGKLDVTLSDSCYAFRTSRKLTYLTAVRRLSELRKRMDGRLYVADCDLRQFFDSVPHDMVREAVRRASRVASVDPKALELLDGYLSSYSLQTVLSVQGERQKGNRAWQSLGLPNVANPERTGLPQGGALSGLLANLVLGAVDRAVASTDVFYARYCDDMIIVAKTKKVCEEALGRAVCQLASLDIPVHRVHRKVEYGAGYFALKSKGPYGWANPSKCSFPCVPWVTFLGYAVKYDGTVRIRKESVQGQAISLREECEDFVENVLRGSCKTGKREEAVAGLFYRLITKGVGRLRAHGIHGFGRCWLSAYRLIGASQDGLRQMRYLDNIRATAFASVLRRLELRIGRDFDALKEGEPTLYFGKPFSYFGAAEACARDGVARNLRLSFCEPCSVTLPVAENDAHLDDDACSQDEVDYDDDFTSGWERASGR